MNYTLKGNTTLDGSIIGNLIYDELGKRILELHNGLFQGTRLEHNYQYQENQAISFSNLPFVLSINTILRQELPNTRVLTAKDVIRDWNFIPELNDSCPDTSSLIIYPKQGLHDGRKIKILQMLGKSHTHVPIIVNGLGITPFNHCSFEFTKTDYITFQELPHLKEESKYVYKDGQIHISKQGINLEGAVSQSGLRRIYRDWQNGLCASDDDILRSSSSGLIQLLQIR